MRAGPICASISDKWTSFEYIACLEHVLISGGHCTCFNGSGLDRLQLCVCVGCKFVDCNDHWDAILLCILDVPARSRPLCEPAAGCQSSESRDSALACCIQQQPLMATAMHEGDTPVISSRSISVTAKVLLDKVTAALLHQLHILTLVCLVQGLPSSHRRATAMHLQRTDCSSTYHSAFSACNCLAKHKSQRGHPLAAQACLKCMSMLRNYHLLHVHALDACRNS